LQVCDNVLHEYRRAQVSKYAIGERQGVGEFFRIIHFGVDGCIPDALARYRKWFGK
jgi:hypothetical protein